MPSGGTGSWIWWKVAAIANHNMAQYLSRFEQTKAAWPPVSQPEARLHAQQLSIAALVADFGGDIGLAFLPVHTAVTALNAATTLLAHGGLSALAAAGGAVVGGPLGGFIGAGAGFLTGAAVASIIALAVALDGAGVIDVVPDDEGLEASLLALEAHWRATQTLGAFGPLGAAGFPQIPGGGSSTNGDPTAALAAAIEQARAYDQEQREIAEAKVEYQRLECHLNDNLAHYAQAIWSRWPESRVADALASYGVPTGVTENTFRGFVNGRGAVRVTDMDWLKQGGLDWQAELDKIFENTGKPTPPELFTLPTQGMVVEPALGHCSACEPYVETAREIELDKHRAELASLRARGAQEQAEADRFAARLRDKILTDPTPLEGAEVKVQTALAEQPEP